MRSPPALLSLPSIFPFLLRVRGLSRGEWRWRGKRRGGWSSGGAPFLSLVASEPLAPSAARSLGRAAAGSSVLLNGAVAVKKEGLWGSQARLLVGWGARASGRRALLGVVGLRGHPVRPPLSASSLVLLFFFLLSGGRPSLLSGVAAARRVLRAPLVGSAPALASLFLFFPPVLFLCFAQRTAHAFDGTRRGGSPVSAAP